MIRDGIKEGDLVRCGRGRQLLGRVLSVYGPCLLVELDGGIIHAIATHTQVEKVVLS